MNRPLALWPGYKLMDLAHKANCHDFISLCCAPEINRRFAGDLLDTNHHFVLPGGIQIVLPVDVSVILAILFGLGFFAPLCLSFQSPPKHPSFCFSTQRRKIPKGYPYKPHLNRIMKAELGLDEPKEQRGGGDELMPEGGGEAGSFGGSGVGRTSMANQNKTAYLLYKMHSEQQSDDGHLLGQLWAPTFR
jgi:hypothetical protein